MLEEYAHDLRVPVRRRAGQWTTAARVPLVRPRRIGLQQCPYAILIADRCDDESRVLCAVAQEPFEDLRLLLFPPIAVQPKQCDDGGSTTIAITRVYGAAGLQQESSQSPAVLATA